MFVSEVGYLYSSKLPRALPPGEDTTEVVKTPSHTHTHTGEDQRGGYRVLRGSAEDEQDDEDLRIRTLSAMSW